jgi:hypothetical protein
MLASCEIADRLPNQTICPTRDCWNVLTEIAGHAAWHRFQPQGGKEYTVHSIHYTVQTFSWLLLSFAAESSASGPQSGKAPYHSLTLPHLFYLYISVENRRRKEGLMGEWRREWLDFWQSPFRLCPPCFVLFDVGLSIMINQRREGCPLTGLAGLRPFHRAAGSTVYFWTITLPSASRIFVSPNWRKHEAFALFEKYVLMRTSWQHGV